MLKINRQLKNSRTGEESEFSYANLTDEQKMIMANLSSDELAKLMEAYAENQNTSYENNFSNI